MAHIGKMHLPLLNIQTAFLEYIFIITMIISFLIYIFLLFGNHIMRVRNTSLRVKKLFAGS